MNWHIGQQIVCIKTRSDKAIKRGEDFKIKGLRAPFCNCSGVLIDVGLNTEKGKNQKCSACGLSNFPTGGVLWTRDLLFAPLDQDISELTEILKQSIEH